MDAVVLGAEGFLGRHMVARLVADGHDVLAVGHADIDLSRWVPNLQGAEQVYCFAADMGGVGYFTDHDFWPALRNARITANVMEACATQGVGRAFFASSACAYPTEPQARTPALRLAEGHLEMGTPDRMYGREKLLLTRLAQAAPFDARVGILHTIYGDPVDRGPRTKFPTAIVRKTLAARQTGVVEIWGSGRQERSYLWIDDAVAKIAALMADDANPGPVNIGREGAISVLEVAQLCADLVGITPEYRFTADRPSGVMARDCDNRKFWNAYGHMEPTDYPTGFGRLITAVEATWQS